MPKIKSRYDNDEAEQPTKKIKSNIQIDSDSKSDIKSSENEIYTVNEVEKKQEIQKSYSN